VYKETGTIIPAPNSRFTKAGGSCFYESEVLNSSFVHLMKFSAENPAFAKRQNVMGKAINFASISKIKRNEKNRLQIQPLNFAGFSFYFSKHFYCFWPII
jgi:hypothetical protein